MPVNYANGKIYKLYGDGHGLVYYGSTVETLAIRFSRHKSKHRNQCNRTKAFEIFDTGDCKIVLVELYPCTTKEELHAREAYYIKNFECVNRNVPLRTNSQWFRDNPDKRKEYEKRYRTNNRKKYLETQRASNIKRKDAAKQWHIDNKEKEDARQRAHYIRNRERYTTKHSCECGGRYTTKNIKGHHKSKMHINWVGHQWNVLNHL